MCECPSQRKACLRRAPRPCRLTPAPPAPPQPVGKIVLRRRTLLTEQDVVPALKGARARAPSRA
jgi:hypothetical protein